MRRALGLVAFIALATSLAAYFLLKPHGDPGSPPTDLPAAPKRSTVGVANERPTKGSDRVAAAPAVALSSPLPTILPDLLSASPAEKLRAAAQTDDIFAAALRAVRSGDPLLVATAINFALPCMDAAVQQHWREVQERVTGTSIASGVGSAPDQGLLDAGAVAAAQPFSAYPSAAVRAGLAELKQSPPSAERTRREQALMMNSRAELTPAQRAAFRAMVEQVSGECKGRVFSEQFSAEWLAARARLVAAGSVGAQLFNRAAGWSSFSSALNERDFALVERALAEFQPDGIAVLLGTSMGFTGEMDAAGLPDDALDAALLLHLGLGQAAGCVLGALDCSPDSYRFKTLCLISGGCEQPDLQSLMRHVFERDGLDPAIVDREVARVVAAYRARDLDAIGVRRKTP